MEIQTMIDNGTLGTEIDSMKAGQLRDVFAVVFGRATQSKDSTGMRKAIKKELDRRAADSAARAAVARGHADVIAHAPSAAPLLAPKPSKKRAATKTPTAPVADQDPQPAKPFVFTMENDDGSVDRVTKVNGMETARECIKAAPSAEERAAKETAKIAAAQKAATEKESLLLPVKNKRGAKAGTAAKTPKAPKAAKPEKAAVAYVHDPRVLAAWKVGQEVTVPFYTSKVQLEAVTFTVLADGFQYNGEHFTKLSGVARKLDPRPGVNGYDSFGLNPGVFTRKMFNPEMAKQSLMGIRKTLDTYKMVDPSVIEADPTEAKERIDAAALVMATIAKELRAIATNLAAAKNTAEKQNAA